MVSDDRLPEHFGKITKISIPERSGYIKSDLDHKYYSFCTSSLYGDFKVRDNVAFLTEEVDGMLQASAIRKIYENSFGLKFISRVDISHIHRDAEHFFPIIFERIKDYSVEFIDEPFEFPNIIGKSICVPTSKKDVIIYAKRKRRKDYSRFVINREPIDTKFITVCLLRVPTHYSIMTAYLGKSAKEPYDERATEADKEFWKNHALIFGEEEVIERSITSVYPWKIPL